MIPNNPDSTTLNKHIKTCTTDTTTKSSSHNYCNILLRISKAALTLSSPFSLPRRFLLSLRHFLSPLLLLPLPTFLLSLPPPLLRPRPAPTLPYPLPPFRICSPPLFPTLVPPRNSTRGFVWLDRDPGPVPGVSSGPGYRVSAGPRWVRKSKKPSDRIARILRESFEVGLPDVRWFVMGDDDTVFFPENLAAVLGKYDHRGMYYVGGNSESVEQDVMHGYRTGFGGGRFSVSYPLACELVRVLDECIERYHNYYGSDENVSACVGVLGVPLTREPGFHQLDVRGDPYGLLAAHSVAPLVSLHHLDSVEPLFPGQTQAESLKKLMQSYHLDPGHTLYNRVSAMITNVNDDPCERPFIYYLDQVQDAGEGKTLSSYKRVAAVDAGDKCMQLAYKYAISLEEITVTAAKASPDKWLKAPRRQCREITNSWTVKL